MQITTASADLRAELTRLFDLTPPEVFTVPGPLDITGFNEIVNRPEYRKHCYEPWEPVWPEGLTEDDSILDVLRKRDILVHHPYDTFDAVIKLLSEAADDPNVLAIKMTLYRTSGKSRVIQALTNAASQGKQVTVLVELKARFDEEQNIGWAQHLEQAGAIVIYGIAELKVHSKAALIVRREREGIRRYVHLGTGNYNEKTAQLYTDMGIMTSREELTYDVAMYFNALAGYSAVHHLDRLVMAPHALKDKIIRCIDREAERCTETNPGFIRAKMNSLADPDVIRALYRASNAGVRIQLNVRGICMLVPGIPGQSEHIEVVSIVGRFLEHSRIFHFHNGGADEFYLSSADWMPRNLERRAELMFPVEQEELKQQASEALDVFFEDNVKAHVLRPDGTWKRLHPAGSDPIVAQQVFHDRARSRARQAAHASPKKAFTVRRKPPGKS